jgi:hypothetical protein
MVLAVQASGLAATVPQRTAQAMGTAAVAAAAAEEPRWPWQASCSFRLAAAEVAAAVPTDLQEQTAQPTPR